MNPDLKAYLDEWQARQHRVLDALNRSMLDMASCLPAPVTASSDTSEFVLSTAGLAEPPALGPSIVVSPVVALAAPIDNIGMVPASSSTERAAQAVPASTLQPWVSVSSSSLDTSATDGVVCIELAHDNDAEEHDNSNDSTPLPPAPKRCSTECPSHGAPESTPDSTPKAALTSPMATVDVIPVLAAAATGDGTLDGEHIKGVTSMASTTTTERSLVVTPTVLNNTVAVVPTDQEHMHCPTPWPPPYLYFSWCDSSKPRPIPWPSFAEPPGGVHLAEPRPPLQGTSGELPVVVDVIYHLLGSLSWISPMHICLQCEPDREVNVTSVRLISHREEQFAAFSMSLNISVKILKKPCMESTEVTVSSLISRGASVFQLWRIPWLSSLLLHLTSAERDGLVLFQWEIAWQLDAECSDYYQWHVALALFVSSTSKCSKCVLAGISPHACSLGVQYCHGDIFERCLSACYATVLLLHWNYGHLNSCAWCLALPCTTTSQEKYASDDLTIEDNEVLIWYQLVVKQNIAVYSNGPTYFRWKIAWVLVVSSGAHTDLGGSGNLTMSGIPFSSLPQAKPPNGTSGLLMDHHSRLGFVILDVLVIWPHFSMEKITALFPKEISFPDDPVCMDNFLPHGSELLKWKIARPHHLKYSKVASAYLKEHWLPDVGEVITHVNFIVCYGAGAAVTSSVFATTFRPAAAYALPDTMKRDNSVQHTELTWDPGGSTWCWWFSTGDDQASFQGGRFMLDLGRQKELRSPWDPGGAVTTCRQRAFDVMAAAAGDQQLVGTRPDYYRNSDHNNEHRLQWDPGGFLVVSAWGQAAFQGGRDVRSLSYTYSYRAGFLRHHVGLGLAESGTLQVPGRRRAMKASRRIRHWHRRRLPLLPPRLYFLSPFMLFILYQIATGILVVC